MYTYSLLPLLPVSDCVEKYRQRIKTAMLQKYGITRSAKMPGVDAFVNLVIRQSKPCRIKGKMDKVKKEPITLQDTEEHSDATMGLSDIFSNVHSVSTKVILLLGKPGMGKTRLMHQICRQWAEGALQQFQLIFLFEFREINLLRRPLTLRELLFDFFLHPEDCPDAVFEHLLEDSRRILVIFDGLDEFAGNIYHFISTDTSHACHHSPLTIFELFASICRGELLPGCTMLVTTRPKILPDLLLNTVTLLVEIWGFDYERVEEYVRSFFHQHSLQERAVACLKRDNKLLSICYVPALCNTVCICLKYFLLQGMENVIVPQTVTQLYIEMLLIFLSRQQGLSVRCERAELTQHRATVASLGELAFKGLEEKKVLFYAGEVPQHIKAFACLYDLLLDFEVKTSEGQAGYAFPHFSLQEFFAALFLLTSSTIDGNSLKQKFFLRSKWTLKKEGRTAFTENCHVFLSGLASQGCRQFLSSFAGQNETWIQERQAIILRVLKKLATSNLTGPKIVELCHCVHETQDVELARHVGSQLSYKYQFRNFRLTPLDMMTLSFVINSSCNLVCLDFIGCPIELDCLDVIASCENIKNLR